MGAVGTGLQVLSIGSQFLGDRNNAKAVARAQRMKARNAITTMNYNFQNFEAQRRDMFDVAVGELEKINLNARGLQETVNVALGEEQGEGRTARAIQRSTEAMGQRAMSSVKDNYVRQSNEIDLNKEQQYIQTRQYIEGLEVPSLPSPVASLLQIGASLYAGRTLKEDIDAYRVSKGVIDKNRSYLGLGRSNGLGSYKYHNSLLEPYIKNYLGLDARTWMGLGGNINYGKSSI